MRERGQVLVAVSVQMRGLRKQAGTGLTAVEQTHVVPGIDCRLGDVPAHERGAANDEDAHQRVTASAATCAEITSAAG
jgi:hypothetical protein